MNFTRQGRPLSDAGLARIRSALGVADAEVWTVVAVETSGFGFLHDRRPQILFERHVFHKLTAGKYDAGKYPRLEQAMALDHNAALQSASWGIGQVMGFNHKLAGYDSVDAMVGAMVQDEDAQLLGMANFIKGAGLAATLQNKDWVGFAKGYNGKGYAKNNYDGRLAEAHAKYVIALPSLSTRSEQIALTYLGINPGPIDGQPGKATRAALSVFQKQAGLPQTGELDAPTQSTLMAAAFPGWNG